MDQRVKQNKNTTQTKPDNSLAYLLTGPACLAKVALSCLGMRTIIVMIINLHIIIIFVATVNTGEGGEIDCEIKRTGYQGVGVGGK